jgi:uncharacterized protein (DUF305 family)
VSSRPVVLAAGGLALAAALTACGGHSDMTGAGASATSASSGASSGAPAGASAGASGADDASRAADVMFAQMMIPHHEQAVQMADLALDPASGAGADVTALATRIKAAQAPEIATMNGWLASWGAAVEDDDMGGMHHGSSMPGMMSDDDMAALGDARGDAFDRMWLTMMVAHHEGALTMADDVLESTQDPRVRTLAEAVVSGQTAEIATMKSLLAG